MDSEGRAEVDRVITDLLVRITSEVHHDAQAGCPVKTGALRESIYEEVTGEGAQAVGRVGSDLHYAAMVELGTAPHIIRAKPGGVLVSDEGEVFGPVVHHPGTKAQPYLQPALFRTRGGA